MQDLDKSQKDRTYSANAGFSLLELLIALAIVGIIAAVALPSYQESRFRTARAEAKAGLLQVASNLERYYSANNAYVEQASPLAPVSATVTTDSGNYIISVAFCVAGNNSCFVATAAPQGGQAGDSCGSLTLRSNGAKGSTAGVAIECWQR